jgi:hypothetical protein
VTYYIGSYAEVVNFATHPLISTQTEESKQGSADVIVVTGKHTNDRAVQIRLQTKFMWPPRNREHLCLV